MAGLRRAYMRLTGKTLAGSSFRDRFTAELTVLLQRLVQHLIETTVVTDRRIRGTLKDFTDVVIADASVIRLRKALETHFPACRTNHTKAALKLHLAMSVTALTSRSVEVTGERVNERQTLRIGPWVKNRLLLLDLGYFGHRLFDRIDRNGGFFVSRLKSTSNPVIVATHRQCRGRSVPVVGEKLLDVLPYIRRSVLDVEVEVRFKRRAYRGKRAQARRTFRLVAIRDEETDDYHTYLTNVPPNRLSADDVALAYKARWQVELMFKACKSEFRLDQLTAQRKAAVEALVYASILTMLVSQQLMAYLRSKLTEPDARRATFGRVAVALRAFGQELLRAITQPVERAEAALLERLLTREALDPHQSRQSLLEVATAIALEPAR